VCGAVIERRRTRSPNKPWPAAVPHDFVNKWTFKWPSKSDQLIDWRTIRRRRYNNNNNNVLQWSVFLWYYYYYYYYLPIPPPPPRVTSPVVQIFFCDFFRFSVYIYIYECVRASRGIFHRIILIWFFFRTTETVYPTTTTARHRVKPKRNFSRPSRNGSAQHVLGTSNTHAYALKKKKTTICKRDIIIYT